MFRNCAIVLLTVTLSVVCAGWTPAATRNIAPAGPAVDKSFTPLDEHGRGRYIVLMQDAPLALYNGAIPGFPATAPRVLGQRKLDPTSAASQAYRALLDGKRAIVIEEMNRRLGRKAEIIEEFYAVLNGFAVSLTPAEALRVAQMPGVRSVRREHMRHLQTDNGPAWIQAPEIWNGAAPSGGPASKGESIVFGIVDSGINPLNPSFLDVGGDGYDHSNPRGKYYGVGDPADIHYDPTFPVNDKLIGAYDYLPLYDSGIAYDPRDSNGHGSHTASTAAGNFVQPATLTAPTTTVARNISGVAPHANLITYRVCLASNGCPMVCLIAGIEQAVLDGVDVINYSIGSDSKDPWTDPDSQAFLAAREAGVFVAASAGNDGPGVRRRSEMHPFRGYAPSPVRRHRAGPAPPAQTGKTAPTPRYPAPAWEKRECPWHRAWPHRKSPARRICALPVSQ